MDNMPPGFANVPTPLDLKDDYGQQVHPDVLHIPEGFCGWEYWMAYTPYPFGRDFFENPTLRVSHDGVTWERHPDVPEPVVPAPADGDCHNADPELVLHRGTLYLVFMTCERHTGEAWFSVTSTRDAKDWSVPAVFMRTQFGCCPTLLVEQDILRVWWLELNTLVPGSAPRIYQSAGQDILNFGGRQECILEIPGHTAWHIDIQRSATGYELLVAAFPEGMDFSRTRLFHACSIDGLTFRCTSDKPLLSPSILGWDNRAIYRSCFLRDTQGNYRIWYSAVSWGLRWGIGYWQDTRGYLTHNERHFQAEFHLWNKVLEDARGYFRYQMRKLKLKLKLKLGAYPPLTMDTVFESSSMRGRPIRRSYLLAVLRSVPWWLSRLIPDHIKSRVIDFISRDVEETIGLGKGTTLTYQIRDEYWRIHADNIRAYEPTIWDALDRFVDSDSLFIDCGANIGLWSCYLTGKIRNKQQIVAVECNTQVLPMLRKNKANNGNGFLILDKAVWSRSGETRVLRSYYGVAASSLVVESNKTPIYEALVETVSIDDIVERALENNAAISNLVIKLDIEGAEPEAIRGAMRSVSKIDTLIIYEDLGSDPDSRNSAQILKMGFNVYYTDVARRKWTAIQGIDDANAIKRNKRDDYDFYACMPNSRFDRRLLWLVEQSGTSG